VGDALNALYQHPPSTRKALLQALRGPVKAEYTNRHLLQDAARALAKESCTLGSTYGQLAAPKDVVAACGAAKTLAAPPPSS